MLERKDVKKDRANAVLLGLLSTLAYWPVAFHIFSVKNDAIRFFLPTRWLISESINNGQLPLWSPYMNLGYPIHADMQAGAWNPFVWLFSLAGPFDLYTLHLETVLYVYLAGLGMYIFLRHFRTPRNIAMLCSTGYMLSGFTIDSSQYLVWIASAAFLPFILLHFYRTLEERTTRQAVLTGFFCYLMFVCAYPAHFILTVYICFAMCGVHIIMHRKQMPIFKQLARLLPAFGIIMLIFLLLSMPALISYVQFLPYAYRGAGASFSEAMQNPLHPFYLISALFPLPVFNSPYFPVTDGLARNNYVGIITILFTLTAFLFKTSDKRIRFCRWAVIISLIFSFGELALVRPLAYYVLPLMDSFRHPSTSRLVTIFFACLLAAFAFSQIASGKRSLKQLIIVFRIVVTAGIMISFWCVTELIIKYYNAPLPDALSFNTQTTWGESMKAFMNGMGFFEILLLNIVIQLPFILFFYHIGIVQGRWRHVTTVGILNIVLTAALLMPFPVVKKDRASSVQQTLNEIRVTGYPLPDLGRTLAQNSNADTAYEEKVGYLNLYNKKPGRTGASITPSNLLSQRQFWADSLLRDSVLNKPVIYSTGSALITTLRFEPNLFEFRVKMLEPAQIVLLQNHYPNWQLYVNDIPSEMDIVHRTFMGVYLPEGDHTLAFIYRPKNIIVAVWGNFFTLAGLLLYFLVTALLSHRRIKNYIKHLFYKTGSAYLFDRLAFHLSQRKYAKKNKQYIQSNPAEQIPPDYFLYETSKLDYQHYKTDGDLAAKEIAEWTAAYRQSGAEVILEWGCGVSRLTRHIHKYVAQNARIAGCDINRDMINWNRIHIPHVAFTKVSYDPPTSYVDQTFTFVYAVSVLTHIDCQSQSKWLQEIHRILRKGGVFLFSTHGERYHSQLMESERKVLKSNGCFTRQYKTKGHRLMTTYHDANQLLKNINIYFEVLEYYNGQENPHKMGGQDLWIVKKRD